MHRLRVFALLLLAACTASSPPPSGAYRQAGAPIWSIATLDNARLAGDWRQVAAFGAPKGCRPGGLSISRTATGLQGAFRLCASGQDWRGGGQMVPTAPGRFTLAGRQWWVLWADGDYRTMVIGTPDGSFGLILNRGGAISTDRMVAAREILEWNGYDLSQL